jgi:hypothetical protein
MSTVAAIGIDIGDSQIKAVALDGEDPSSVNGQSARRTECNVAGQT